MCDRFVRTPSQAERAGTRHEIYQLMNAVLVERIVVLIGDRDDSDAISAELCHGTR
jgi:hypothetical protein